MKFWTVVALSAIGAVMGCDGGSENQDRVDAILALTGDPVAGDPAYQTSCADCHAADAAGGTGPNLKGYADAEKMATQVLNGGATMPPFDALPDQTIADIIAWTQSL